MLNAEEGGRFKGYREQSAFYSAMTVGEGGNAAVAKTKITQADAFFLTAQGNEDQKAFLDKLGITPDQDLPTQLRLLAPEITGPGGANKLFAAGFHETTRIGAVIKSAKAMKLFDATLKDPRLARARTDVLKLNTEYGESVPGRQQAAENAKFTETIKVGMQGLPLRAASLEAEARMIEQGRNKPRGIGESLQNMMRSGMSSFGGVSGENLNIDAEAVRQLVEKGKKAGVDVYKDFPRLDPAGFGGGFAVGSTSGTDYGAFQEDYKKASDTIAGKLDAAGNLIKSAAKDAAKAQMQAQAPSSQGRYPAGTGGGGGGFVPTRP
jgi:hypothetical protein